MAERLAELAGPGLAPESAYRERVEKRRKARWAKRERHVLYRFLLPRIHAQLDAELREERRALQGEKALGTVSRNSSVSGIRNLGREPRNEKDEAPHTV
jgi:hypothetical protein